MKQAGIVTRGQVATPCEPDDDAGQGTPSVAAVGDSMGREEELKRHGRKWL